MGKFQPGQEKPKSSGRQKGTANKKSQHLADVLDSIGLNIPERLAEILPQLPVEKQADVLVDLMSYVFPKRKAVEQTNLNLDLNSLNFDQMSDKQIREIHAATSGQLYRGVNPRERDAEIDRLIKLRERGRNSPTVKIVPKQKCY